MLLTAHVVSRVDFISLPAKKVEKSREKKICQKDFFSFDVITPELLAQNKTIGKRLKFSH